MDPNDPENGVILRKTPAQWINEICQKRGHILYPPFEQNLQETPQDKPIFRITMKLESKDGAVYLGEGVATTKRQGKHIACIDLLNKMGETRDTLQNLLSTKEKEGNSADAVLETQATNDVDKVSLSKLRLGCFELGLEAPMFKILEVTGEAHMPKTKMLGEIPMRGVLMDPINHVEVSYGQRKNIKQKVAAELLKQVYKSRDLILASVVDWANESRENTSKLPQECIDIIYGNKSMDDIGDPGREGVAVLCEDLDCKKLMAHDVHGFIKEFNPPRILKEFIPNTGTAYYDLLLSIVEDLRKQSKKCKLEIGIESESCEDEENNMEIALLYLTFTYESWEFTWFGGIAENREEALEEAAQQAVEFLKENSLSVGDPSDTDSVFKP